MFEMLTIFTFSQPLFSLSTDDGVTAPVYIITDFFLFYHLHTVRAALQPPWLQARDSLFTTRQAISIQRLGDYLVRAIPQNLSV